jgi:hypothetical protein
VNREKHACNAGFTALELRESGGFALTRICGAALLGRLPILITDHCVS